MWVIWPEGEPQRAVYTGNPLRRLWMGLRSSFRGRRMRVVADDLDGAADPVFVARFCETVIRKDHPHA